MKCNWLQPISKAPKTFFKGVQKKSIIVSEKKIKPTNMILKIKNEVYIINNKWNAFQKVMSRITGQVISV